MCIETAKSLSYSLVVTLYSIYFIFTSCISQLWLHLARFSLLLHYVHDRNDCACTCLLLHAVGVSVGCGDTSED